MDARKEHYYLGFDKSLFKPSMEQVYDFERTKTVSSSLNLVRSTASAKTPSGRAMSSGIQASIIAEKQKQCHVSIGGAPSNQKSVRGDNKTTS